MFWFGLKKRVRELEGKTQEGFSSVKGDMDSVGKWVKHLDRQDKQLFDSIFALKTELSSVKDELFAMREGLDFVSVEPENGQPFKKLPVLDKQTPVEDVQNVVQTAVQSGDFYENLRGLSTNERAIILTLMNSDMKLSYEDLALLMGKERSTVRGQINSIRQKSEGLIEEIIEKNGKKRVYVSSDIRDKMQKYAKVRVGGKVKGKK